MINQEAMLTYDRIISCGHGAKEELIKLCNERGIEYHYGFLESNHVELYLEICRDVLARWHTTNKFKVGDKVYVVPSEPTVFKNCIRATVTETGDPKWGYHLRAFEQDLPGIYMFNIWDKDLLYRTSKKNKSV